MANIILTNHAHMHIYIKVPYFTSFVGLGLVVGLGAVVSFNFFIAFFLSDVKDQQLQPPQVPPLWHNGAVSVLCLLSHGFGVRIRTCYLFFLRFLKFFIQVFCYC